ncbi:COG1470 family protein [Kaistella yonginensis]|uniref:COG1470 family protein n=1 Tax=Kaistella yonginensis TaxID=658267 RepID=UPI0025B39495|nr:hypothetical protein [Kaistella yonginensis]MDN3606403.1 hypothetical protein [Kaistella yonginensis]
MSNFVKRYNNPLNLYPTIRKILEINSNVYSVGAVTINSKAQPYICCRDYNGSILWEKVFDLNNVYGAIFENVLIQKNGSILLLAAVVVMNERQLWLINITTSGEKIWVKKYYDYTYYIPNENYNDSFPSKYFVNILENGNIALSILENLTYYNGNTDVRRMRYFNFYKINYENGEVLYSKKTNDFKFYPSAIISRVNSILVISENLYSNNNSRRIKFCEFDENFNNLKNYDIHISGEEPYKELSFVNISNVINNKALILGHFKVYNTENDNQYYKICFIEYDFFNDQILKIYKSDLNHTSFFERQLFIRQDTNFIYFFNSQFFYKINKADMSVILSRELLFNKFLTNSINDSSIYVACSESNFDTNFIKSDLNFINCKTVQSNNFNIFLSGFSKINEDIIATIANNNPNYSIPNCTIINILDSSQTDACPPTYDYNLKLESSTIYVNPLIRNRPISEAYVRDIIISNSGTSDATLFAKTVIATEKGVTFKTENVNTIIPANGSAIIKIFISGTPIQAGFFSPLVEISSPFVDNLLHSIRIPFVVNEDTINGEIISSLLSEKTYFKGSVVTPNPDSYGSFTVKNNDPLRVLIIPAGTILYQEISNKFEFRTAELVSIPPLGNLPVFVTVSCDIPRENGDFRHEIVLSNQQYNIINLNEYEIVFHVVDEPLDIQITKLDIQQPLIFIQGYNYPRQFPRFIGKMKIKNFTQSREITLGNTILGADIDGLQFKTRPSVTLKPGEEKEVEIVVTKAGEAIGNFTCPIDLTPEITPNTYNIPFTVIEDVLDVELTNSEFRFPRFIKNTMVTDRIKGVITIQNNSLVKPFTLEAHTIIHNDVDDIAGLVFQTVNDISIEPGMSETIEIELNPLSSVPTDFGHFYHYINIGDVKNTVPFLLDFEVFNNGVQVDVNYNTSLQSPSFALQAVGSKGIDSPKGIQLRWLFGGNLGNKHLPKGDMATNEYNFNKPNDYVNAYRVPYTDNVRVRLHLDLTEKPHIVNNSGYYWLYKLDVPISNNDDTSAKFVVNEKNIYVYFRNKFRYNDVIAMIDPFRDPFGFIEAYGENIIEIESKNDLFFRVSPLTNKLFTGDLYLEVLSVEENKPIVSKFLSYRKKMTPAEVRGAKILVENGRSIRFKKQGTKIHQFDFEFYSDFISSASYWNAWQDYGNYALTTTTNIKTLNLILGNINGKWLRYNEGEFVRKQNYVDKWNYTSRSVSDPKRGIRELIEKYLSLSTFADNPRAEDYLDINFSAPNGEIITETTDPNEENGTTKISYLDLLQIAALDYHIARLLGLGILDNIEEANSADDFIYLTEYKTLKDPLDESKPKPSQLLSMSLPTSCDTERLPIPIEIAELYKGIPNKPNEDIPVFYDDEGYTFDGKNRMISIISKPLPSAEINPSFFSSASSWDASLYSPPIYAGLEYKIGSAGNSLLTWKKPELSHDIAYKNVGSDGQLSNFETVPIILPENFWDPLYVHRQTMTGDYYYSTYSINIFSRARSSNFSSNISTTIKPKNTLLPPSDIKTWLILPEKPLMFTSEFEQEKYAEIEGDDKTFVRINFDYNAYQDLVTHSIPSDSGIGDDKYIEEIETYFPDEYDLFADYIETYYRKETPKSISARLFEIKADPKDKLCAVFKTMKYHLASTNEDLLSILPQGTTFENFIGSIFLVNNKTYVIKNVEYDTNGLKFTVYKEEVSQAILSGGTIAVNFTSLTLPTTSGNDLFVVMENMQSTIVWGNKYPNLFTVPLNFPIIKREIITSTSENGSVQKYLEKSRGFWTEAEIRQYPESGVHMGMYEIIIRNFGFGESLGITDQGFYELNNGYVRAFRNKNVVGNTFIKSRDVFKVIRTQRLGKSSYILYVYDSEFKFDENGNPVNNLPNEQIQTGSDISINYYPSYFLYLYKNDLHDLTKDSILPTGDHLIKQSIFGFRSVDENNREMDNIPYKSKFSAPSIILGQKIIDPQPPEQPIGSLYATRPDFYGKATYSFTTKFQQKPYGVQFCRTDNNALLSALYESEKVKEIYESLASLGGNKEEFLANRWNNFFDYKYLGAFNHEDGSMPGVYKPYPEVVSDEDNPSPILPYAFPLPDKKEFFEGINKFIKSHNEAFGTNDDLIDFEETPLGTMKLNTSIIEGVDGDGTLLIDFVREVVEYTFVPLTEIPIIYQHIKTFQHPQQNLSYLPLNKKQRVRDDSGYLLKPGLDPNQDPVFDMAPMMTIMDKAENITLFTDFTLNGTTNNLYFYASREIGSQMTMSDLSPVLGPVKLVDSNPAEAPKILSGLTVLENKVLGIQPKIKIEVQSYPEIASIKKINLYRAENRLDAESILSMKQVEQLEISDIEISEMGTWNINDSLEDFDQIPFGDTLFYRVTVEKEIQYADPLPNTDGTPIIITDYVPSQASKILVLLLTETSNPDAPVIESSGIRPMNEDYVNHVTLEWNTTCYKGIYHLYSMSSQGNWKEIARCIVNSTNDKIQLQVYNSNPAPNQEVWENKEIIDIADGKIAIALDTLDPEYLQLLLFDENGNRKYYHFKVVVENTSNMFSIEENILTLFTDDIWNDLQGISSNGTSNGMIIEKTFIIK